MTTLKSKKTVFCMLMFLLTVMTPVIALCQDIDIQVSPNVLNVQNSGEVVTIHTDIVYAYVDASTVELNGVEIESWKSDNKGYFVAKFDINAIKGLEGLKINQYNTITLSGLTVDGEYFTGSQDVLVINVIPKRK